PRRGRPHDPPRDVPRHGGVPAERGPGLQRQLHVRAAPALPRPERVGPARDPVGAGPAPGQGTRRPRPARSDIDPGPGPVARPGTTARQPARGHMSKRTAACGAAPSPARRTGTGPVEPRLAVSDPAARTESCRVATRRATPLCAETCGHTPSRPR